MILWPDLPVAIGFTVSVDQKAPISVVKRLLAEDLVLVLTGKRESGLSALNLFGTSEYQGSPELIKSLKALGISDLKVNVISEDEVIKRLK